MGTLRNVLKKRLNFRQGATQTSLPHMSNPASNISVRRIPGVRVGELDNPKPSKQSVTRNEEKRQVSLVMQVLWPVGGKLGTLT